MSGWAELDHIQKQVVSSVTSVDQPIGIFDSGFGGLTVARASSAEDYVYIGDTVGATRSKPLDDVRGYANEPPLSRR